MRLETKAKVQEYNQQKKNGISLHVNFTNINSLTANAKILIKILILTNL